ncbi:unnamed protein product [Clavelina lepadiformis]|uniref:Protein kinase domain-containing protein n=1 Tax=Clavelina lepadiformis TaxID=159417 RepID=A0ABP0FBA6_CLALP
MSQLSRPWSIRPQKTLLSNNSYIRNLPYSLVQLIAAELDPAGTATNWKDLALRIPKGPHNPEPKFTIQHIRSFEAVAQSGKSPTMAIMESWSTSNATVQNLMEILSSMGLHSLVTMIQARIAQAPTPPPYDEIAGRNTGPPYPPSIPGQSAQYGSPNQTFGQIGSQTPFLSTYGQHNPEQNRHNDFSFLSPQPVSFAPNSPSPYSFNWFSNQMPQPSASAVSKDSDAMSHAYNLISHQSVEKSAFEKSSSSRRQPTEHDSLASVLNTEKELATGNVTAFSYASLKLVTSNFNNSLKLGEGAFGCVFQGHLARNMQGNNSSEARKIAIKRLKLDTPEFASAITEQFKKEIHVISELKHENILPLMGYSYDGPELCLIYDYMYNGSLSSRLELCRNKKAVLKVGQRLEIARGSASGISYLHKKKLIHRDIKSSNILLDSEMKPRISDFGLIRSTDSEASNRTSTKTNNPIGTLVYMSPEAYKGVVSNAMDVYSFGVVLLELLTGMAVMDENRDPCHLTMYIEEMCDVEVETFFDTLAGEWCHGTGQALYDLGNQCVESKRTKRPSMQKVFTELSKMCEKFFER